MRRSRSVLLLVLAGALVLGSLFTYRAWRKDRTPGSAAGPKISAPAVPDLSRWPKEFRERVNAATNALATADQPAQPLGELAVLYFGNDYAVEAESVLKAVRALEPQNPRWAYFLGVLRLRAKDRDAALPLFAEAAKLAPYSTAALVQEGDLLAQKGQLDQAQARFDRVLILQPDDPQARYGLAKIDFTRADSAAAMRRLEPLVQQHPEYQEAHLMLADLLDKAGDPRRGAEQRIFLRGAKPTPPFPDPWVDEAYLNSYDLFRLQALGVMRLDAGQCEAAIPYLRRAAELDPNDAGSYDALAKAYSGLKRLDTAQDVLETGLGHSPESDLLHARLAEVLTDRGQTEEALRRIDAAIAKNPSHSLLHLARGRALARLDRLLDAVAAFREAVKLDSTLADAQIDLGRALLGVQLRADGKAAIIRSLAMRPDDQTALEVIVAVELEDGEIDAAETHAERLFQAAPNRPEALSLYAMAKLRKGNIAAEAGRHAEAEALYAQGLSANPGFGELHGALGMLYGKQKRWPEAAGELKYFIDLSPSDPLGYILLGSAYASVGQPDDAKESWTRGLAVARKTQNEARTAQLEHLLEQTESAR